MARLEKPTILTTLLLFSVYAIGSQCLLREKILNLSTPTECQTEQIGDPWTSASQVACTAQCLIRYPDICQSSIYNNQTKICRAGSVALRPLAQLRVTLIPEVNSNDTIYYAEQPVPPCTSDNFTLYEMCGLTLCLHLGAVRAKHSQAQTNCQQIGGRLFVADTMAKFAMFMHISKQHFNFATWIGLDDLDKDGTFMWANGEALSQKQHQYIWTKWEPNNSYGNEPCVDARNVDFDPLLRDYLCKWGENYICEPHSP